MIVNKLVDLNPIHMKKSDLFAKRFLSVCLGISALLLSGSLFLYSLKTVSSAQANPYFAKDLNSGYAGNSVMLSGKTRKVLPPDTTDANIQAIQAFGLGMRDGIVYFGILYNNNTIGLHKTECTSEDIMHW